MRPRDKTCFALGPLTQSLCVILCDLTTCFSVKSAWFQRLKLIYGKPLSNFAFNFNLRRYTMEDEDDDMLPPRQHDGDTTDDEFTAPEPANRSGRLVTYQRKPPRPPT